VHKETRSTGRVLGGRAIEKSGGAVCGLHRARGDEQCEFLSSASKPRSMVCQWFGLKTTGMVCRWFGLKTTRMVFSDLTSKPVATVFSNFASKLLATVISDLALKPVVIVSFGLASKPVVRFLVEPQNQCGGGFPGLDLKNDSYGLVIWASKSPRLFLGLGLKTK
jgi:hypothetical protein